MMKRNIKERFKALSHNLGLWREVIHYNELLNMARQRVFVAGMMMSIGYAAVAFRLVNVMVFQNSSKSLVQEISSVQQFPRGEIYDRNGNILATHLVTASVYANPKVILDASEAALKLSKLFPDIGYETLYKRLNSQKGFIWVARHITPKIQQAVNELGIPGVYLQKDYKRVYPYGHLSSHIVGYCGIDGEGLAGIEKFFHHQLADKKETIKLSVDLRIQHIVRDVLLSALEEFQAVGGNAMVMDLKTGEMLSMVSLPDFDPNQLTSSSLQATFNRNTLGVYEPGSTFKILNAAIALETGKSTLKSVYDARFPIKLGRFTIDDFKGKRRYLTLTEAFVYSSNIASIKIAQEFGYQIQKEFMKKFGVLEPTTLEIPEIGQPLVPSTWKDASLMTISYGYGISVTPLQMIAAVGGIINNGQPIKPSLLLATSQRQQKNQSTPIISLKTSQTIRELMRMVVSEGTAKKADIEGYEVFGKTGTAYQAKGKSYSGKTRTTSFIGAFPFHNPQYMIMVMLDDPKASKETYGYATAGWNAAPTAGRIIARIAPLLGLSPSDEPLKMKYVKSLDQQPGFVTTKHTVD